MGSDRMMKAARFHGMGQPVAIEEVAYPEAGPEDVILRVSACGVCGSDIHFLEGMPVPGGLPFTLGHEPAGVIESFGSAVRGWEAGERVAVTLGMGCGECRACQAGHPNACPSMKAPGLHYDGAFAEAIRVAADCLVRVPDNVPMTSAALATDCVATPYHALKCRARMREGERVAVIGAGGIGNQGVVFARHFGAEEIVAVDRSEIALERAIKAGATATVKIEDGVDPTMAIRDAISGGADVALECVGIPETVSIAVRSLVGGGRAVAIGVGMLPPPIPIPQAFFCLAELSLLGSFASHKEDLAEVLELQASGAIDIETSISHRMPLDEAPEALEMLMSKRGDPQRIVVEVNP